MFVHMYMNIIMLPGIHNYLFTSIYLVMNFKKDFYRHFDFIKSTINYNFSDMNSRKTTPLQFLRSS